MHATDAKTQKIEPDPNFFMTKVSEAVCKRDCHNVRSYLFFYVRKCQTKILDSMCNDLYCILPDIRRCNNSERDNFELSLIEKCNLL